MKKYLLFKTKMQKIDAIVSPHGNQMWKNSVNETHTCRKMRLKCVPSVRGYSRIPCPCGLYQETPLRGFTYFK